MGEESRISPFHYSCFSDRKKESFPYHRFYIIILFIARFTVGRAVPIFLLQPAPFVLIALRGDGGAVLGLPLLGRFEALALVDLLEVRRT